MRLARADNRILYSFDNRVLAPYALTYLPCVKKYCLLIRAHADRTDYRMHRCGDFLQRECAAIAAIAAYPLADRSPLIDNRFHDR